MSTERRAKAEAAGRRAETISAIYLMAKGFRIIGRRFKTPSGEIDLIARRGRVIAFVEVKHRPTLEDAISAVPVRARRRIERAADLFIASNPRLAQYDLRYDIIAIAGWRLRHLPGAWRYGE